MSTSFDQLATRILDGGSATRRTTRSPYSAPTTPS